MEQQEYLVTLIQIPELTKLFLKSPILKGSTLANSTPNIELVLPKSAINSVAMGFYRAGFTPFAASLHVASRPFVFDGNPSTGHYSVKNLATGNVTEDYLGATIETVIIDGDFIFYMDNGDILNVSESMRQLAAAVHERMTALTSMWGKSN